MMLALLTLLAAGLVAKPDAVRSVEPLFGRPQDPSVDVWKTAKKEACPISNGVICVSGGQKVKVIYASYPGPKPMPGPDEIVLKGTEGFTGTARLKLRHLSTNEIKEMTAVGGEGPLRFKVGLDSCGRWQFESLTFEALKNAKDGVRLGIAGIDVITLSTAAEALRFDIDTGDPVRVLRGKRQQAAFVFANPSDRAIAWQGACRLRDYFGTTREIPVRASVATGKTVRVPFDAPTGKGVWYAKLEVAADDGSRCVREVNFAVLDENRRTPLFPDGKFRMGINYHMGRVMNAPGVLTNTLHALELCGAKLVRVDAGKFNHVMPTGPDYCRWERTDLMVDILQERGLGFDSIILGTPTWARDTTGKDLKAVGKRADNIPARRGLFRDYCETLARRYGTKISYYEIGNEPDLRRKEVYTPDEYVERIYNEAYEGIKRGCPEAKVIPGGFAKAGGEDSQFRQPGFQERFLELAGHRMDVHPVHMHCGFKRYSEKLSTVFFKNRKKYGITAPWYSNESALSSFRGMEQSAAVTVWKKILWAWGNGSRDYIWYNLRATGWDPQDPEQGYGLISADFQPRATFAAFSSLANLLSGLNLDRPLVQQEDRYVYRFSADGGDPRRLVLAGWDERAVTGVVVRVQTDARQVWAVDLMGNRTVLTPAKGQVAWRVGNLPGALLAEGATRLEPVATELLRLLPQVSDYIVPAEANGWIPDAFHLDKPEKVFDVYAANPETVNRAWKGNDDLSATVWMHPWSNSVRMVIRVVDDIHCQTNDGKLIFKGDSIQYAVALPGDKGSWEVGLARLADGTPYVHVWLAPMGVDCAEVAKRIPLKVSRKGKETRYETYLPYDVFGLNYDIIRNRGFRFNLLVNDNDGFGGVDCWTEIKPGIATDKNAAEYPWVRFR